MMFQCRRRMAVVALAIFAAGVTVFSARLGAQDEGWQIVRADYGFKSQRTDVSDLLKDLIARGGVNGRVAVNNQTMGGDPAPGRDKVLRVFARNRKYEEREFTYNEGGFVDVRLFSGRREDTDERDRNPGRNDRDGHSGDRDADDWKGLQIIRAFYGVQGRTVNVIDLLRARVRDGMLSLVVTNNAMGGDPAPGADKMLIVIYKTEGKEQAVAVREGNTLTIP
jgi:hypothetical protein